MQQRKINVGIAARNLLERLMNQSVATDIDSERFLIWDLKPQHAAHHLGKQGRHNAGAVCSWHGSDAQLCFTFGKAERFPSLQHLHSAESHLLELSCGLWRRDDWCGFVELCGNDAVKVILVHMGKQYKINVWQI